MPAPFAPCTICGTTTDKRCKVCQAAHYCSKKCQREDWLLHKLLCGSYRPFIATRPESKAKKPVGNDKTHVDYKAAIHFPCLSEQPTLIWVEIETTKREHNDKSSKIETPKLGKKCHTEYWVRLGRELDIWGDAFMTRDMWEVNKCFQVLNAGYRQTTQAGDEEGFHVPFGNRVAMYYTQEEQPLVDDCDVYTYHDVTLGDFRSAFEFFSQDNNTFEGVKPNPYYLRKSEWVKAVKISARNEMKIGGVNKYWDIEISQDHFIFSRIDDTSSIARHMGFGLLLVRDGQMKYTGETNGLEHAEHRLVCSHWDLNALDLIRQWDLGSSRWGLLDGLWTEVTPDMGLIVARDNREVLTFHHVEALILFTQHELMVPLKQGLKAEAQGVRLSNEPSKAEQPDEVDKNDFHRPQKWRRERFIKEYFLSRKFEEFFEKLKEKKLAKGDASWADAIPPPHSKLIQAEGPELPGRVHSRKEGSKQQGHPAKRKRDVLDST